MKSLTVIVLLVLPTILSAQPALASQSSVKFAKPVSYASGGRTANSVAVGDVNGDGKPDLVVANRCYDFSCANGSVSVLLGNGDGTFQSPTSYASMGTFAESLAIGDLNGDGKPDLVVVDFCQGGAGDCSRPADVDVLLGNGDGTFQTPVSFPTGGYQGTTVAIGDLNGDGHLDLVVGNGCTDSKCTTVASPVGVLLGNGDGSFRNVVVYDAGGDHANSVAIGDVNADGKPDLLTATDDCQNNCIGAASVMLGNGDGTFQPPSLFSSDGRDPDSIAIADLDGDGYPDLVLANFCAIDTCDNGSVSVMQGNGNGTFQSPVTYNSAGIEAVSVAIGDVNGDGHVDVIVANLVHVGSDIGFVGVLLGNGNGTLQSPVTYASGGIHARSVSIRDVNGDGEPDLLVANSCLPGRKCSNGSIGVLLQMEATTTKLKSSINPSHVNQSVTFSATITSIKPIPDGEVVTFYAGTTKLGTGATTNGLATLTSSFSLAGAYAIKAKYPGDPLHLPSVGRVKQVVSP